ALGFLEGQLARLDLSEAALRGILEKAPVLAFAGSPLGFLARHRSGGLRAGRRGTAGSLSAGAGLGDGARSGEGRAERDEGNGLAPVHVASLQDGCCMPLGDTRPQQGLRLLRPVVESRAEAGVVQW